MNNNHSIYLLAVSMLLCFGCQVESKQVPQLASDSVYIKPTEPQDTLQEILEENINQEDIPINDYLTDQLKPIRANFKRINSITNWTTIDKHELWESTEGGEAKFYYNNKTLEKIVVRHFGEMFQQLTEYYLMDSTLSFVFEKSYQYNRPLYYDTTKMKAYHDSVAFDFDESLVIEERSYFSNGELVHQLNNQDCGSPFTNDYLLEQQQQIQAKFDKLIQSIAVRKNQ